MEAIAINPAEYMKGKRFPRVEALDKLHFELVYGCQLQCIGCPISTLQPKVKRVSPEVFEQCMRNVDVDYIRYLRLFNYGETLLHPNLSKILEIIPTLPQKIKHVEISTNGQFAHWDDLTRSIQSGVLTMLAVSCDGDGTPESYERLRPPSKWKKLLIFLERVAEIKEKYAPNMLLLTRTICPEDEGRERWKSVLEPRGWTAQFRDWLVLADAAEDVGNGKPMPKGLCSFMQRFDELFIDWDGMVVPCCAHPGAGNFGNLKEHKFNDLVYSMPRMEMMFAMGKDRKGMNICGSCGVN